MILTPRLLHFASSARPIALCHWPGGALSAQSAACGFETMPPCLCE
jgi:hypothetical protein